MRVMIPIMRKNGVMGKIPKEVSPFCCLPSDVAIVFRKECQEYVLACGPFDGVDS